MDYKQGISYSCPKFLAFWTLLFFTNFTHAQTKTDATQLRFFRCELPNGVVEYSNMPLSAKDVRCREMDLPPLIPTLPPPRSLSLPDTQNQIRRAPAKTTSTGSGFAVNETRYVTNAHVVRACQSIRVNGKLAKIVGLDTDLDLAVLSGEAAGDFPGLRTNGPRVGEAVIVAGYPLSSLLGDLSVTTGNVIALSGLMGDQTRFRFSAPVQPGNSGGPVLDSSGNVIGIVSARINHLAVATATGSLPENIGFAVTVDRLRSFLDRFKTPYLLSGNDQAIRTDVIAESIRPAVALIECDSTVK
jgi:S1-C subfamily serine protease